MCVTQRSDTPTKSSTMVLFQWLTDDDNEPCLHQFLLIILLLHYHNSICNRHYLHCSAILDPQRSPWKKLYKNADMTSFLHMMGLTHGAFASLLDYLFDLEEMDICCRWGRLCSLSLNGYLGLLLFYLGNKMKYEHLCLIPYFWHHPKTICSWAISMMLKRMVQLLWGHPIARVQFPDEAKMMEFANMIQRREPMVDDIIGFMDRVSFPLQCMDERVNQNAMYCGYDCNTMVNNVFAYGPDGKVFFCSHQLFRELGGWHVDGSFFTLHEEEIRGV